MKLWTQAIDSKESTVSQFHSFTKRHGGWGAETMGGWGKKQGPREQGNEGTRKQGAREQGSKKAENREQGTVNRDQGTRDQGNEGTGSEGNAGEDAGVACASAADAGRKTKAGPSAPLKGASLGMTRLWVGVPKLKPACSRRRVQGPKGPCSLPFVCAGAEARALFARFAAWLKPSPDTEREAKAGPSAPLKSASLGMTRCGVGVPGLKPGCSRRQVQGPEGPCSLQWCARRERQKQVPRLR